MQQNKLELIGFKLCPYVQKAIILLNEKQVEHKVSYIDLDNKPPWFLKLSPLGKVPILLVDDEILFESSVICEYLDEAYKPTLHPSDILLKAKDRSWIEFGSSLSVLIFQMAIAKNHEDHEKNKVLLLQRLNYLEKKLNHQPWFNGDRFSLVDLCYAPFFKVILAMESIKPLDLLSEHPKILSWSNAILDRNTVSSSFISDYDSLLYDNLRQRNGWITTNLNSLEY